MSRITRLAVLMAGLMSLFAMLSASAGAVTWHNTGTTNFTATGGIGTLSSTGASLTCTGSNVTGDAPNNVVAPVYSVTGTINFTGCLLGGIASSIDCAYTLTAATQIGTGDGSQITGNIDATCGFFQFGAKICHAQTHGTGLHAIYTNPATTGGTGTLTVTTGKLTTTNGAAGTCPLGSGDVAHLSHLHFTTSTHPPTITRTA